MLFFFFFFSESDRVVSVSCPGTMGFVHVVIDSSLLCDVFCFDRNAVGPGLCVFRWRTLRAGKLCLVPCHCWVSLVPSIAACFHFAWFGLLKCKLGADVLRDRRTRALWKEWSAEGFVALGMTPAFWATTAYRRFMEVQAVTIVCLQERWLRHPLGSLSLGQPSHLQH